MNPIVSIIIPTYNRAHLISETLQSISVQTYQNWECIVVDDSSNDNTAEILQKLSENDPRFKYFTRPSNVEKGPNGCRNYGFEKSSGDYILWFDSDDLLKVDALQKLLVKFSEEIDVVVSKVMFTKMETGEVYRENTIISNDLTIDYLTGKISFYVCGPIWKRTFLQGKKLFDTNVSNLDDWDFNLRMIYQNPKIVCLDEALYYYRVHINSLSSEIRKLNAEEIKSEFKTRAKHLAILKTTDNKSYVAFLKFVQNRNQYVLREALVQNNKVKFWLLKNNIKLFLSGFQFWSAFKITVIFIIFVVFKKGYNLLS